jgi:hypothetical protein
MLNLSSIISYPSTKFIPKSFIKKNLLKINIKKDFLELKKVQIYKNMLEFLLIRKYNIIM